LHDPNFNRFRLIQSCDGRTYRRTDRQTDCDSIYALWHAVARKSESVTLAPLPELQMLPSFHGASPLTLHRGLCPLDPRWTRAGGEGGRGRTPYIGSRSRARHDRGSSPPNRNMLASPLLVDFADMVRPTIMISSPYGSHIALVFLRQISYPYSNGMTFKFKVKYKWGRQKCGFLL